VPSVSKDQLEKLTSNGSLEASSPLVVLVSAISFLSAARIWSIAQKEPQRDLRQINAALAVNVVVPE
jgi:hypothetical protein